MSALGQKRTLSPLRAMSKLTLNRKPPMSALGQKQTLQRVRPMSALPPKADITECDWNVR